MNKRILIFFALSTAYYTCHSQRHIEVYTTVQGTWDKVKNHERAQFGGNNNILNRYFSDFSKVFLEIGMAKKKPVNATAELMFRVNMNDVDSIRFLKSSGLWEIDSAVISILRTTSGKWRPAKVDDVTRKEDIKIWIHVFSGDVKNRPQHICAQEANDFFSKGNFQQAINAYDEVLNYNELNAYATVQKGLALIKLNKLSDACLLWKEFERYQTLEIANMLKENCE